MQHDNAQDNDNYLLTEMRSCLSVELLIELDDADVKHRELSM